MVHRHTLEYNHFYDLFLLGQSGAPDWQSWQFRTIDNPFIDPAESASAKETMDARTYRQEFEASFEALSGRVYYAFSRVAHVAPVALDLGAPVAVSCDFNVDPCCGIIAQKLGDELRVWREVRVRHAGGDSDAGDGDARPRPAARGGLARAGRVVR